MKKIFLVIIACTMTMMLQAQSSLDYKLNFKAKVYNQQKVNAAKGIAAQTDEVISVIGTLKDDAQCPTRELAALGVKVVAEYYGLVVMKVSMSQLEELGKVQAFREINANGKPELKNDESHKLTLVADVQDSTKLPEGFSQIYTGKDVIVGIVDTGFDFQHKNFKDADGKTRIKRVWLAQDDDTMKEIDTEEAIGALTTDFTGASHGTHTVGTAAGSYNGEYTKSDGTKISGFRGAAYEADIILSTYHSNANVMESVRNMWKYARSQKKPLVISLSLGSNNVWMDGRSVWTDFFKGITNGGTQDSLLINLAAGNEGWQKQLFHKKLNKGDKIATQVTFSGSNPISMTLASEDTTPFNVTLYGYDTNGNIAHTYTLDNNDGQTHDVFNNVKYMITNDKNHDGRYYIEIGSTEAVQKIDADYVIEISAPDKDCEVRSMFLASNCSNKLNGLEKADLFDPVDDNSLSDWAQHKYAFAVGAYTSRVNQTLYNGGIYSPQANPVFGNHQPYPLYDIAPFSSWVDVPYKNRTDSIGIDFLSPGSVVLSSVNHYDTTVDQYLVAKADDNNLLGAMYGTSMATPNASGIMALWLQACPSLSVAKVREIINKTADNDEYTLANPRRTGAGKINCLKGLQEILKEYPSAIQEINSETRSTSEPATRMVLKDGHLVIIKDGREYNVAGQEL